MDTQRKPATTGSTQQHETLGAKASDAVASAREQGRQVMEQGKQKASELADQAQQQAGSIFDERKTEAANRLDEMASALRQTSHELQNQEDETFARYAEAAAEQVERFSHYLQQRDFGQLMTEAKQMARRQPELFVTGALALGFLAGRFLKSSGVMSGDVGYRSGRYDQVDWYDRYDRYEQDNYDYDRGYYGNYSPSGYGQSGYGQSGYGQSSGQDYTGRGGWSERDEGRGVYGSRPYSGGYNQGSAYGDSSAYSQGRGYGDSGHSAYGGVAAGEREQPTSQAATDMSSTSPDSRYSEFRSQGSGSDFGESSVPESGGSSAQQGNRTPADPTGSSNAPDTGRSNPTSTEGRQRDGDPNNRHKGGESQASTGGKE
jgi:hypothetical protein